MTYQALYRVWRPRTFKDLVGQTHITQTLQNAISDKKFSHAYIFSGPRGTGKTSAAKIFAQTINCEQMPTREPCNECDACRGILDGSISDVIEIDAASNTSVDDIREIRDKVKYASSSVPYKVYIIDEVHMISVNAFNALLKTLEEPPPHVVFILATTEPHKIPLTIVSRCQRFDFKPISNNVIVERMKQIVEHEDISVTQEALEAVALAAQGGMRDALSLLDQAISYSDDTVQIDDVLAVTGSVAQHVLTDIIEALHDRDIQRSIQLFNDIVQSGKDPGRFIYDSIYFLRDILFYKATQQLSYMLERAIVDDAFINLTEKIDREWIQYAITALNDCQHQIKWINNPKVMIEVNLIMIAQEEEQEVNHEVFGDLSNKLLQLEKEFKQVQQEGNLEPKQRPKRQQPRSRQNSYNIPYEQIRGILDEAEKESLQLANNHWQPFLDQLKAVNAPAHATIQNSKPAAASTQSLIVAFKYEIHCSLFLEHKEIIETIFAQVIGKGITIIPIPVNDWTQLREEYVKMRDKKQVKQKEEESSLITEARKLVGDDLLEIHD